MDGNWWRIAVMGVGVVEVVLFAVLHSAVRVCVIVQTLGSFRLVSLLK